MASSSTNSLQTQARLVSTILKTIRLERRMRPAEVAQAMGMAQRTYENFEAGRGRLDLEKIRRFAQATRSDPVAILLGVMFGSVDTALRAMENKAAMIQWIAFDEFQAREGDLVATLPAGVMLQALRHACEEMSEHLRRRDNAAERWLEQAITRLYTDKPDDP
jgi:transcriptional regulator with XRE-family HTH domain